MNDYNETRNDMNNQRNATTLDHYYNRCEGYNGKDCENTAIRALLLPRRSTWAWLCDECAYEAGEQARREEEERGQHGNGDAA